MTNDKKRGLLTISVHVAEYDDPYRSSLCRLAAIHCQYGEARDILTAWKKNNPCLHGKKNSPLVAVFFFTADRIEFL